MHSVADSEHDQTSPSIATPSELERPRQDLRSEVTQKLIEAMEAGRVNRPVNYATDADWWWGVVEANSTVFIRRVEIKGVAP